MLECQANLSSSFKSASRRAVFAGLIMSPCGFGNEVLQLDMLIDSVSTYRIIESYPDDKYVPSFLIMGVSGKTVLHAQLATDVEGNNVRVVTMYVPNPSEWDESLCIRRTIG